MFRKTLFVLAAFLITGAVTLSAQTDKCVIKRNSDGTIELKNTMMDMTISSRAGVFEGISKWKFNPTGQDMIDPAPHTWKGAVLGENFDAVDMPGVAKGHPFKSQPFYLPLAFSTTKDGSAAGVLQECGSDYRMKRTLIMRRDYAVLELRYEITNISGEPKSFAMRFMNFWAPGAKTGTPVKNDTVFMEKENGITGFDQTLKNIAYDKKYLTHKHFLPRWNNEPPRIWVGRKQPGPALKGNWAMEVNNDNGHANLLIANPKTLIGFYNCPRVTVEPVLEAVAYPKGKTWKTDFLLAGLAGCKGKTPVAVTPLYIDFGQDGVVALFRGTLELDGKRISIDPTKAVSADIKNAKNIAAYDSRGKLIGTMKAGKFEFAPSGLNLTPPKRPVVKEKVVVNHEAAIKSFLNAGDFTVYCGWHNYREVKEQAKAIANQLGVGVTWQNPGGRILAIGAANDDGVINDIGMMKTFVTKEWPGKGKGGITAFKNLEFNQAAAVVIAGCDVPGTMGAINQFKKCFLVGKKAPTGFTLSVIGTDKRVYPYSRAPKTAVNKIDIKMAKGEYESSQLMLTAYSKLSSLKVDVSPLVNAKNGKEISTKYRTHYRSRRGPIQVRWVNYYPLKRKNGSMGTPDPLMARSETSVPAGESRGIWLTFIVPAKAEAGVYRSTLTCETSAGTKTIPIQITVWDFDVPIDGIMGQPYTDISAVPNRGGLLKHYHVKRFIQNMVEHGMRIITPPGNDDMFHWHFSPEAAYKGVKAPHLTISDDGKVALDTYRFDEFVKMADSYAKPFKLKFMLAGHTLLNYYFHQVHVFNKTLPARHMPPEKGMHRMNNRYAQEMYELFKKYLVKRGWFNRVYLKLSDEPKDIKWWSDSFTKAAKAAGLKITTATNSVEWKDAEIEMMDMWKPLFMIYNRDFIKKAQKAGKLVGYYNCGPQPRISLTGTPAGIRGYIWLAAKEDLDFVSWWGIQNWRYHPTIWNEVSHSNSVVYPEHPEKGAFRIKSGPKRGWYDATILDSIRWELIREGMEDAWFVNKLRREINTARKKGLTKEADKAQKVLDGIFAKTFPTMRDYNPPYSEILKSREILGDAISKLAQLNKMK